MPIDTARQLQDLLRTAEAFRTATIEHGALVKIPQNLYIDELRALEGALQPTNYVISEADAVKNADNLRETIARAVYRYQEGPGTFDEPGSMMGDLIKKIATDEAENIRRAIMGEPELPLESDSRDVVF